MYRWWETQAFCISECNGGLMVLTGCSKSLPWSGVHLIVGQRRRGSQDRKCQQTQGHRQSERRISKWPGLNWRCRGIRETNSSKPHTRGRGNKALWTRMGGFVISKHMVEYPYWMDSPDVFTSVRRKQLDGQYKPGGFGHASFDRVRYTGRSRNQGE